MSKTDKSTARAEPWDTGELGRDEQYAKRATPEKESAVDEALGLHLISIRLQNRMIDDLKFIAKAHGVGYQPLIRDILDRFIVHEYKAIVRDVQARQEKEELERKQAEAQCRAEAEQVRQSKMAA